MDINGDFHLRNILGPIVSPAPSFSKIIRSAHTDGSDRRRATGGTFRESCGEPGVTVRLRSDVCGNPLVFAGGESKGPGTGGTVRVRHTQGVTTQTSRTFIVVIVPCPVLHDPPSLGPQRLTGW